jgi:hypothetical protein
MAINIKPDSDPNPVNWRMVRGGRVAEDKAVKMVSKH